MNTVHDLQVYSKVQRIVTAVSRLRRMRGRTLATAALFALQAGQLHAQLVVGDSIRVRRFGTASWIYGRLVTVTGDSIRLRTDTANAGVSLAVVERLDRWDRKNVFAEMGKGGLAGGAAFLVARLLMSPAQRASSSDPGMQFALFSGAGMAVGALGTAAVPGLWHSLIHR